MQAKEKKERKTSSQPNRTKKYVEFHKLHCNELILSITKDYLFLPPLTPTSVNVDSAE